MIFFYDDTTEMDYVYAFYICNKTIQCTVITYWVISRIQNPLCCKQGSSFVIVCICILLVCFNQMLPTSDGNIIDKQNASVYLVCHWSFFFHDNFILYMICKQIKKLELCLHNPLYFWYNLTSNINILVNHSKFASKPFHTKKIF